MTREGLQVLRIDARPFIQWAFSEYLWYSGLDWEDKYGFYPGLISFIFGTEMKGPR